MKRLILFLALILISGCSSSTENVCFESNCFEVEVSDNVMERTQGLMFRNSLDENKGMLFIFPEPGIYGFWMKNTLIPLDIIWINSNLEVVYISKNTQPCQDTCNSIILDKESLYVLEINANLTDKYSIKVGDKVEIK